jgi:hypothetical protein
MSYILDFVDRLEQEARDARNQLELANEVANKWRDESNRFRAALEKIARTTGRNGHTATNIVNFARETLQSTTPPNNGLHATVDPSHVEQSQ